MGFCLFMYSPVNRYESSDVKSPIYYPEDHQLLVAIKVRHWPLNICSWHIQCYRNVVMNTIQLTHLIPSSTLFPNVLQKVCCRWTIGISSVTGTSWWILYSWIIKFPHVLQKVCCRWCVALSPSLFIHTYIIMPFLLVSYFQKYERPGVCCEHSKK